MHECKHNIKILVTFIFIIVFFTIVMHQVITLQQVNIGQHWSFNPSISASPSNSSLFSALGKTQNAFILAIM
jgi:hypothetical protein